MNDDNLDEALQKCFQTKFMMDECLKIKIQREIYEKQEQRNNFLLCLIQTAMYVLSLVTLAVILAGNQRIMLAALSYFVITNFIGTIAITLYTKNNINKRRSDSYD